jgi:DNA-binding NarL/FixJ family response regulator
MPAAGYVLKDISPAGLADAIRAVHRGESTINPGIARQLLTDIAENGSLAEPARRGPYGLTEREVQVLAKVAAGLSDKEIAAKLFLSESTVKSHLRTVYQRLRLRNRAQAAAFAIERKLVDTETAGAAAGVPAATRAGKHIRTG